MELALLVVAALLISPSIRQHIKAQKAQPQLAYYRKNDTDRSVWLKQW